MKLKSLLLVPILALLAACGGGGDDDEATAPTTPTTPAAATLQKIVLSPDTHTLPVGATLQLVATGTYSDGKSSVVKDTITWSVQGSNASVATTGLVTAKGVGKEIVKATVGTVSGSAEITVVAPWAEVAAGGHQTIALKREGSLWAWGSNNLGQLGIGSNIDQNKPIVVTGGVLTWKQVSVGEFHTLAVRSDGTLWSWGFNQNGQLGIGNTPNGNASHISVPTQVGTAKDWVAVAAGKAHSLATNKAGMLYAWGRNFNGQLGDGTKIDRSVPTRIGNFTNWKSITAGANHSAGTRSDLSLWAWGANEDGQVGDGTNVDVSAPVAIGTTGVTWVSVAAGGTHTMAIRADGALFAWGANGSRQLGDGATADQNTPIQIGMETDWAYLAAGFRHSLAVKVNGTLWAWGSNTDGQLGIGTFFDKGTPTQVAGNVAWRSVAAGLRHSFATQTDGTLWGWGRGAEGQQGNASIGSVPVPVQLQ